MPQVRFVQAVLSVTHTDLSLVIWEERCTAILGTAAHFQGTAVFIYHGDRERILEAIMPNPMARCRLTGGEKQRLEFHVTVVSPLLYFLSFPFLFGFLNKATVFNEEPQRLSKSGIAQRSASPGAGSPCVALFRPAGPLRNRTPPPPLRCPGLCQCQHMQTQGDSKYTSVSRGQGKTAKRRATLVR